MAIDSPQIGYLLKQAQSLLHARMEEALRPLGLTVSHYSCLHHLRLEPGISSSVLARRTFVTRQSMNVMLQQLIDRGLVSRPDRADSGRALPTVLTQDGIAALDAAERLVDGVEQRMVSGLTATQSVALGRGLAASVAALAGYSAQRPGSPPPFSGSCVTAVSRVTQRDHVRPSSHSGPKGS